MGAFYAIHCQATVAMRAVYGRCGAMRGNVWQCGPCSHWHALGAWRAPTRGAPTIIVCIARHGCARCHGNARRCGAWWGNTGHRPAMPHIAPHCPALLHNDHSPPTLPPLPGNGWQCGHPQGVPLRSLQGNGRRCLHCIAASHCIARIAPHRPTMPRIATHCHDNVRIHVSQCIQ